MIQTSNILAVNVGHTMMTDIFTFSVPTYMIISQNISVQSYNPNLIIEKILEEEIVINQITNNYVNPVLQQKSKFIMNKIANNTFANVNLFNNATNPVYYMRVTNGLMSYANQATDISFVEATLSPTTYSYWQFNSVKRYRVTVLAQCAITSNTNASHRLSFFDITSNTVIQDTIQGNVASSGMVFTMDFEFISGLNNAYTFVITPSAQVYATYAFASFNIFIEEIVSTPLDTYYFNSASLQSFKFENQSAGNVAVNLKNTTTNWRI